MAAAVSRLGGPRACRSPGAEALLPGVADTIAQMVEVAVDEVILGKASPQEALSKYQENATKLMQENQEKFGV